MIIKLKNVRISFCQNLFKPGAFTGGTDVKYSSTFLVKKDDAQVAEIKKAITAAAADKWGAKAEAILKGLYGSDKVCMHDGGMKAQYDGFDGCYYISASNKVAPLVIDKDRSNLIEASGRPYAGCYVNCSLDIWAMDNSFGKRINATLRGVQFAGDGDAFVGSVPASENEFDVIDNGDDLV